jgi:hypothetical protein
VTRHFEQVFILPTETAPDHPLSCLWRDICEQDPAEQLTTLGFDDVPASPASCAHWRKASAISRFRWPAARNSTP